eukprot:707410-Ditylum_brightwellii.AAC.1
MLKALLDSGAGASLIMAKHCNKLKKAFKRASFNTVAGNFHTAGVATAAFQLTELNSMANIDYKLHVVNSLGVYNMILGRNFLKILEIILNHAMETIMQDDASIPMKTMSAQSSNSFHIKDPKEVNNMIGRIAGDMYKTIL